MLIRPWWCQDEGCRPIAASLGAGTRSAGSSCCSGRSTESFTFTRGGIAHENDAHFCMRTQIRGVVMLEMNEADFEIFAQAMLHALHDYRPDEEMDWARLIAWLGDDLDIGEEEVSK